MLSKAKVKLKNSVVKRSLKVLPRSDFYKVILAGISQLALAVLDLLGVVIIGVIGALAVRGIQSQQPGIRVTKFLEWLNLDNLSFQSQVAILTILASSALILKTIFSALVTRKFLAFLANKSASITISLTSRLLEQSILFVRQKSSQENLFALTSGINAISVGVLGSFFALLTETFLLSILFVGVLFVDPWLAISTLVVFGILSIYLYKRLNQKASQLGNENARLTIQSSQQILESLESYREMLIRGTKENYIDQIAATRYDIARSASSLQFLSNVTKYFIEVSLVLSTVIVFGYQFLTKDSSQAISSLSIFLAAGSRIAPSVMRLQQNALLMKASAGSAKTSLDLIDTLNQADCIMPDRISIPISRESFVPSVKISELSFSYPGASSPALCNVNLEIDPGESVAVVGASGSGKSTLIDLLLGVLTPAKGTVLVSGVSAIESNRYWKGLVGYVPQEVFISDSTIMENVCLGLPIDQIDEDQVWKCLSIAQMIDDMMQMPKGLRTNVGERGGSLSGGQRQRIGVARALYTNPKLLILDEATSALDGKTEFELNKAVEQIGNEITTILIAHRLSSVRNCDKVIYLEYGRVLATGKFDEVRKSVPNFDEQARLMGLE